MKLTEHTTTFDRKNEITVIKVDDGDPIPKVGDVKENTRYGHLRSTIQLMRLVRTIRMHGYTMYVFTYRLIDRKRKGSKCSKN